MYNDEELIRKVTQYLGEGKVKGDEVLPKLCPICEGGGHHDKYTFALNIETGASNCMRGSCGWQGSIKQLAEYMGVEHKVEYFREHRKKVKTYKMPEIIHNDLTKTIVDYFKTRGISQETLIKNRVSADKNGNIVFNYYRNDELTFIKYKIPRKQRIKNGKKEMKSWREADTEPVLYGMDDCDPKYPLIIVEGEPDKLVLDECGVRNAVSIPSGTKEMSWIENCWTFLERFSELILWSDSDKAGKEFMQSAIVRLDDWKLKVVKTEHKDANIVLHKEGKEAVIKCIKGASVVTKQYITDLADVKRKDYKSQISIPTGFKEIDRLLGGMYSGQLVVWTGYNGSGKSTLLSNVILNGLETAKTFAYSGELPKEDFKEWTDLQLSGKKYLSAYTCSIKKQSIAIPDPRYYNLLDGFYKDNLFLFDSEDYATDKEVLKAMEYMAKREGVKVFLIDNLMTVPAEGRDDENAKVSRFIIKLKKFARKFGAVVHLVAHPKKPAMGQTKVTKYDVSGTANISNLADRVIGVHRLTNKDKQDNEEYNGYSSLMTVFKDRKFGVFDKEILFNFEGFAKRFYTNDEEKNIEYSWVEKITPEVNEKYVHEEDFEF